jgi:hypothetical protein
VGVGQDDADRHVGQHGLQAIDYWLGGMDQPAVGVDIRLVGELLKFD